MLHSYFTVKEAGEHEIVIEKSRFICHLSRVSTEQEAQEFIQKIKNSTGMRLIIARLTSLAKTTISKKPMMMENQAAQRECRCLKY